MSVQLKLLESINDFQKMEELYNKSLSAYRPSPKFYYKRRDNEMVDLYNVVDGHEWVGFVYVVSSPCVAVINLIAIDEKGRSKGYGSTVLDSLKELHQGKPIAVLIEAAKPGFADFEIQQKRKAFYERNGFVTHYYAGTKKKPLEMMIYGDSLSITAFTDLTKKFIGGLGGRFVARIQTRILTKAE